MSRGAFFLAIATLLLVGCANKQELHLYGKWEGAYVAPQSDLKGYVQLYATNHRFKLHMASRNQSYDASGTWTLHGSQIVLGIKDMSFDGMTVHEAEEHKVPYVVPDEVRAAYGHSLVLDLSEDRKSMEGLPMTVSGLSGRHVFHKMVMSSYVK